MAIEGAPSRGQTQAPCAKPCPLQQRCLWLKESKSFSLHTKTCVHLTLWVNGCLLYYFLYFSMFEICHHFKEDMTFFIELQVKIDSCCSKLSQFLCNFILSPNRPVLVFSQTTIQASWVSFPYLRNDLKIVKMVTPKSVAGNIVFNFQNSPSFQLS